MSIPADILARVQRTVCYSFSDPELLARALTHPSYAAENPSASDYERLEFLGDAVLGLVVAERLFEAFPEAPEGELTRRKIAAVSGARLATAAREAGIQDAIALGHGEQASGAEKDSILENVLEALVGAVYLDGGLDAARTVVDRLLGDITTIAEAPPQDPKSALQELTQARGLGLPSYRVVESSGPPHAPRFVVEATVAGRPFGRGEGPSKRQAEKAAAAAALETFKLPDESQAPGAV
ncbi:MAG: ribonuclease III [Anaerosomatales bacterium]|nr:ribonuclease III [Anaerosomatales bacterium]